MQTRRDLLELNAAALLGEAVLVRKSSVGVEAACVFARGVVDLNFEVEHWCGGAKTLLVWHIAFSRGHLQIEERVRCFSYACCLFESNVDFAYDLRPNNPACGPCLRANGVIIERRVYMMAEIFGVLLYKPDLIWIFRQLRDQAAHGICPTLLVQVSTWGVKAVASLGFELICRLCFSKWINCTFVLVSFLVVGIF